MCDFAGEGAPRVAFLVLKRDANDEGFATFAGAVCAHANLEQLDAAAVRAGALSDPRRAFAASGRARGR